MGTYFAITTKCPHTLTASTIESRLEELEHVFSTYDVESTVSRFNRHAVHEWFPVEHELVEVVAIAERISVLSEGAFDITVFPLVEAWGFGPAGTSGIPSAKQIANIQSTIGYQMLEYRINPSALRKSGPLTLDFSGIAKGYAVDQIASFLEISNCSDFLVDIGGEIRAKGASPVGGAWRVGVERPDGTGEVTRLLSIGSGALASSGDYNNIRLVDGERLSHIIDPRSGRPIDHTLVAVTVYAPEAVFADAWGTALLVVGFEMAQELSETHGLATMLVTRDDDNSSLHEHLSHSFESLIFM